MDEGIPYPHARDRVKLVHVKDVKWTKLTLQQWNQLAKGVALAGYTAWNVVPGTIDLAYMAKHFSEIPVCDENDAIPRGQNFCRYDVKKKTLRLVTNLLGKEKYYEVPVTDMQSWARNTTVTKHETP